MYILRTLAVLLGCVALSLRAQNFVPTVTQTVPAQALAPGGAAATLDLSTYFGISGVTGQVVRFDTVFGKFDVGLRPDVAPQAVANFLSYVQGPAGANYTNSFFHRSSSLDASGLISIVQGGGFYVDSTNAAAQIATHAPVPLEYHLPNARGTLAAARTSDPNSATSGWYFNVRDNSSILDQSNGGGYTVFGQVLGNGMTVLDAIAALSRVNAGGGDPNSPFQELPVRNYTSGSVKIPDNLAMVNSVTAIPLYPGTGGTSALTLTAQSSATNVATVSLSGSTLTVTPVAAGTATVTVQAADLGGNTVSSTFTVTVAAVPPSITSQPSSQTIATGNTVVFSAGVTGASSYQWEHNGTAVGGATSATLVIRNATSADAGTYTVVAQNSFGSVTSSAATLSVANAAPADIGRLVNLSIRSGAGTADQTLTVGFAVGGGSGGSLPLLLRAVGPSLSQFGLNDFLPDPVATVYSNGSVIASNDNWNGDAAISALANSVGAFALTSDNDAALATSPGGGAYTMQVTGNGTSSGTALAEIYDATGNAFTASSPRLINVSARTEVGTGNNILIAGFVVRGSTSKTVLIRASGPALKNYGVTGWLIDPKLQLYLVGNNTPIATNDNWGGDPQITAVATSVGAFPITDGASTDAALLVTLPPGNYTAQVSGADGGTGVALVEVYEVP
ncbi:MAG TPA: peptidylprolyl isomerase [Opitutaceae bacterium]|nr:peptidylprolyl isomerase [Opitutaceae bacterium]